MPRTTINIDASVLAQLKKRSRLEGKSMGEIVSELLARHLSHSHQDPGRLEWATRKMGARFDLEDKELLRDAASTLTIWPLRERAVVITTQTAHVRR